MMMIGGGGGGGGGGEVAGTAPVKGRWRVRFGRLPSSSGFLTMAANQTLAAR